VAKTTTTSIAEATPQLPNAVNGMELRMVDIADIVIPEGRHKRRERRRESLLGESMDDLGLDTPVSLSPGPDGKLILVAGGGRLAQAQAKGWTQVHALIKVRDKLTQAASTAAENIAREDLSPAEEADAMEILIKAGDTPEGAARKIGLTPQERTQRMALVELPEEIRAAFHWDGLSVRVATLVKDLYDGNHDVGLEIGKLATVIPGRVNRALEQGPGTFFRELGWLHREAKLTGKPPFIATFHRGSDSGRSLAWNPGDRDRFKLKGEAGKWFTDISKKAGFSQPRPRIVLSEEDLDAAVAIGFAYHSPGEHGHVWVHDRSWLTDQINEFVLPRMKKDAENASKESPLAKLKKAMKKQVDLAKMTAAELAPTLERKFKRELQPKAYAANVALGEALTQRLAVTKLTREQALFFAYETLGADTTKNTRVRSEGRGARRIAECAARVMADWITVENKQLKSGKTKTTVIYLQGAAAEKRMWDYIKAADTPEGILQRTLHMYAAAAFFRRECGPNGKEPHNQKPGNETASRALAKLVKPVVPVEVKRLEREIDDFDATVEAERMIAQAKGTDAGDSTTPKEKTRPAAPKRRTRSGSSRSRVLAQVEQHPGVTIPELASKLGIHQNQLYKLLPALDAEGKVQKHGRGWHPTSKAKDAETKLPAAA
jgi:ParB/RepB/Spo0J family partition protein